MSWNINGGVPLTSLEEVRKAHQHELDRMRQEHENSLALYQSELNELREKAVIQFSRLHERQADAIAQLHDSSVAASRATKLYLAELRQPTVHGQELDALRTDFRRALIEWYRLFFQHRIYFDDELDSLAVEVQGSFITAVSDFEKQTGEATDARFLENLGVDSSDKDAPFPGNAPDLDAELAEIEERLGQLIEKLVLYCRQTLGSVPIER